MSLYPWHEPVVERLVQLCGEDQLPNGIALTCAEGWGLDNLVRAAVLRLLQAETSLPLDEFAHPDFRWVVPEKTLITVDQVRRVNEFAVQTCQLAPRKVAVIYDAHRLNAAAANALLKTLEEPPPNTHLLLASSNWGKLLPTIRSRCQRFNSRQVQSLAGPWLAEQGIECTPGVYAELGYAPVTAARVLEQEETDVGRWLAQLSAQAMKQAVDAALQGDVSLLLARWYRRLVRHLGGERLEQLQAPDAQLLSFVDELTSIRRQIDGVAGANARVLLEYLIVRWLKLLRPSAPR